jgi:hypothetical protein
MPHYFYIYNISSHDFGAIQTVRGEIYLFTIGTPYKIDSRMLVLASFGGGIFPFKYPSPETVRYSALNLGTRNCQLRRFDTLIN